MRRTGTDTASLQPPGDSRWQCGVPSAGSTEDREKYSSICINIICIYQLTVWVERDGHELDGRRN